MVFLAITAQGLHDALDLVKPDSIAVWCGADAVSQEEFDKLRGQNLTRFTYALLGADEETMADALSTIEEHHPGERIWVEGAFFAKTSPEISALHPPTQDKC